MAPTKKKKKKSKKTKQPTAIILLLLLLILFALLGLYRIINPGPISDPEPSPTPSVSVPPTLPPSNLSAQCFGQVNGYRTYVTDTAEAHLGLDISSHQGWIDWYTVAESDVDYVILRAGYRGYSDGEIFQDEYFSYNLSTASETDLDIGIYFFSQALTPEEAAEEANLVLSLVEGYDIDYPIFYDWEPVTDKTARTSTISSSELTSCAETFCEIIEEAGYEAGVYFNLAMASSYYHLTDLNDYEFWLAEYQPTPSFPFEIDMWQYTCEGTVPGIDTNVDLNLSFTSYGS